MLAVTTDLRWEHIILVAGVITALVYLGRWVRKAAKALDRWDSIPEMAESVKQIQAQVVPPQGQGEPPQLPLHQRVAVLELAVSAIRSEMATSEELVEHTGQDAANFETINGQLETLVARGDHDDQPDAA